MQIVNYSAPYMHLVCTDSHDEEILKKVYKTYESMHNFERDAMNTDT
jgi:hypothetical protein